MIEIRNVKRTYGDVCALDDVSMTVSAGEAVGLVGTNGAGKTTLFRLLVGHATPDAGSVRVAGREPTAGPALRERVGFVPEDAAFDPRLTAREVLSLHARLRGVSGDERDERVARVLATVGLVDAGDRRVDGYSNGMVQRLAVGTALVRRPDVLLLDEPTAALDPQGVDALHAVIDRVRDRTNVTLVVTSHVLHEVERLCDRVVVLHEGRVKARGSVNEVAASGEDEVRIHLRPIEPANRTTEDGAETVETRIQDAATAVASNATVVREGDAVVVSCSQTHAFEVLETVRDVVDLDGFEVHEPGLADAFDEIVERDEPEPQSAPVPVDGGDAA